MRHFDPRGLSGSFKVEHPSEAVDVVKFLGFLA